MPSSNTPSIPFGSLFAYACLLQSLPGSRGFIPHYLSVEQPTVHDGEPEEDTYERVRCLPYRELGPLVAGLELSATGDWYECRLPEPYGVLAWHVGEAIKVRSAYGLELAIPFRDCVLIAPSNRTPVPSADVADPDDAWRNWLNENLIVLAPKNPPLPEPPDAEEYCWYVAIGNLAHLAYLRRAVKG